MNTLYHTPSSLRGLYLGWKDRRHRWWLGVAALQLPIYKHTLIKYTQFRPIIHLYTIFHETFTHKLLSQNQIYNYSLQTYNMVLIQDIKEVYQLHIKQCFTDMIFKYTKQMRIHLIKLTVLHIRTLIQEKQVAIT